MRPWRPPLHASPAARKVPISSKRVSSQDPLLRKIWNFSLNSLNFHPNFSSQAPNLESFSSQAPKFGNFQLTSPQIWKFSAHKPPFSEANVSSQAPHFGNLGRTPVPEKKLSAPPPPGIRPVYPSCQHSAIIFTDWNPARRPLISMGYLWGYVLRAVWQFLLQDQCCLGHLSDVLWRERVNTYLFEVTQ